MSKISEFDIEELVRGMADLDDEADVYDYIQDVYSIDWDNFCSLIMELLPLIEVGKSPLTGNTYKGLGKDGMFFIKLLVNNDES